MTEGHKMMRDGIKPVKLGCTCGLHRSTYTPEQRTYYNYMRANAITISEHHDKPEPQDDSNFWVGVVFIVAIIMIWIF